MAKTGVVKKPFPYAADGVNIEHLREGQTYSFPDRIFAGLEDAEYIEASDGEPENSATEAAERDVAIDDVDTRLMGMSDQELKDIIARSGAPMSGNMVHAVMVQRAKAQLLSEREGKAPVFGVDPNSGVTEQPLAAPGQATPNSAAATVERQQAQAENIHEGEARTVDTAAEAKAAEEAASKAAAESDKRSTRTNQVGDRAAAQSKADTTTAAGKSASSGKTGRAKR